MQRIEPQSPCSWDRLWLESCWQISQLCVLLQNVRVPLPAAPSYAVFGSIVFENEVDTRGRGNGAVRFPAGDPVETVRTQVTYRHTFEQHHRPATLRTLHTEALFRTLSNPLIQ